MSEPYSEEQRQKGRDLVKRIWWENGGMSAEEREELRTSNPDRLRQIQSRRRKLSLATKRAADGLYSKDTHFLYELIQNAENNSYERAASQEQKPFLKFSLHPGKLVVESNEDGFSAKDLMAICGTNESTRKTRAGYVGKKGVGFKSVFKVAKKVHIQSGPYSFSFAYSRDSSDGEDGRGMVTPIQEQYYELPESVRTRVTLTLLARSDFSKRVEDLKDLPEPLLLFLTKLRKLRLQFHYPSGDVNEVIYSYRRDEDRGLDIIVKIELHNGEVESERESLFRVAKRVITDLPFDGRREGINQAAVVLAFPVNESGYPVLESQDVFAYLPLRNVGFKFLIQSDFITQPSREDIFHSPRNEALLRGVAETFRDAVLGFCTDDIVRYRWMRYLPPDTIGDEFWRKLGPRIVDILKNEPVVRSSRGVFYNPSRLSWVPNDCRDSDGNPLFSDLDREVYMDNGYSQGDFELLKPLGSTMIKWDDLIDRVAADLARPDSKMRSPATDGDWHTRVATLLSKPLKSSQGGPKSQAVCERLRSLPLVPLRGGKWVSASSTIYFPSTSRGQIPTDLDQSFVCSHAVKDYGREEFFSLLGAKKCDVKQVLQLIGKKYERRLSSLAIEDSIQHLRYLFWSISEEQGSLGFDIRVVGPDGAILRPDEIYLPDALDEYSAENLFDPLDGGTEGFPAKFLPIKYLQAVPRHTRHNGRSWTNWLETVVGISSIPRLTCRTGLSEDFRYIMTRRPDHLVGLLQKHWSEYKSLIPFVGDELRRCEVPTEGDRPRALEGSYLPLPRLKALVREVPGSGSIFVRLPESIKNEDEGKWAFLKQLGVRLDDDMDFYWSALSILRAGRKTRGKAFESCAFRIYSGMTRNCRRTEDDAAKIRGASDLLELIFNPAGPRPGTPQQHKRPRHDDDDPRPTNDSRDHHHHHHHHHHHRRPPTPPATPSPNRIKRQRRRASSWPPRPTAEDLEAALAKEASHRVLREGKRADDEPPNRGSVDQEPVLVDAAPEDVARFNSERRFVLGRGSRDG